MKKLLASKQLKVSIGMNTKFAQLLFGINRFKRMKALSLVLWA